MVDAFSSLLRNKILLLMSPCWLHATGHAGAKLGVGPCVVHCSHCCAERSFHSCHDQQVWLPRSCRRQWLGAGAATTHHPWWVRVRSCVRARVGRERDSFHMQLIKPVIIIDHTCLVYAGYLGCCGRGAFSLERKSRVAAPISAKVAPDLVASGYFCDKDSAHHIALQSRRHVLRCLDLVNPSSCAAAF